MSDKTVEFPWGVIIERYMVAGYEVIKYEDTFLGKTDGDILWHVDGFGFNSEGAALIYVGLRSAGVDINTAPRLAWGLLSGFVEETR
jgi:hypothetical protein